MTGRLATLHYVGQGADHALGVLFYLLQDDAIDGNPQGKLRSDILIMRLGRHAPFTRTGWTGRQAVEDAQPNGRVQVRSPASEMQLRRAEAAEPRDSARGLPGEGLTACRE